MGKILIITQRDLVLLPFPFSDQSGTKVRPALIISNSNYNNVSQDVVVLAVTSKISGNFKVTITNEDLDEGNLIVKSCIKVDSVFKISKSLIIKKIGVVSKSIFNKTTKILNSIIKREE